jgi:hypothetical protein
VVALNLLIHMRASCGELNVVVNARQKGRFVLVLFACSIVSACSSPSLPSLRAVSPRAQRSKRPVEEED